MATTLETSINKVLQTIASELTGTIGISIVEVATGMSLSALVVKPGFDLSVAAAYNAEVVKQKMKAIQALKLSGTEALQEMLITLTTQVHVIRFMGTKHILYFAGDASSANLGMIRSVINTNSAELVGLLK